MKTKFFASTLALVLIMGCNRSNESAEGYNDVAYENAPAIKSNVVSTDELPPPPPPPGSSYSETQKLIKEGYLRFETDNLNSTSEKILSEAKKVGAYISRDSESKAYDRIVHYATIKVPAAKFDAFIEGIATSVKYFDEKNITVTDVTEQYVDLEARLKTKKELEAHYLELLKQAKNVKDMLEIEREIGTLRADIESMEGTFRVLKHQISYATVEIHYYIPQIEARRGFGHDFMQALRGGWDNLVSLIVYLFYIWPFLLFLIAIVWFIVSGIKKRRSKA